MKIINLKKLYPFYQEDVYVAVSEELFVLLQEMERQEQALLRKIYRYQAFYSLDRSDGIAEQTLSLSPSPEEMYAQQMLAEALQKSIAQLPAKQNSRIIAHFFEGKSQAQIARAEGVHRKTVHHSIQKALQRLALDLEKFI